MKYSELHLRAWTGEGDAVHVLVHSSPAGSLRQPIISKAPKARFGAFRLAASSHWQGEPGTHEILHELGRELASILLPEEVSNLLAGSLDRLGPDEGLRVRLCLDEELVDLPWEYLLWSPAADPAEARFLIHDPRISLVREAPINSPTTPPSEKRWRAVVVGAFGPGDDDPWAIRSEFHHLQEALAPVADFLSVELVDGRGEKVAEVLREPAEVFHYIGHTDQENRRAFLVREFLRPHTVDGNLARDNFLPLYADRLSDLLRGSRTRLAVFSACNSGNWCFIEPMLRAGLPAVIGVQGIVSVRAAIAFSARLYSGLAVGLSLDEAVAGARFHILDQGIGLGLESCEWGSFMVYLPTTAPVLFPRPVEEPVAHGRRESFRNEMRRDIGKRGLRKAVVDSFSDVELTILLTDLREDLVAAGVDAAGWLDPGPGATEVRAFKLIESLERRGLIEALIKALARERPKVDWASFLSSSQAVASSVEIGGAET
jgi:CHAT domain